MKTIRNMAIAGCSMLLLTQCASQDEIQNLQYQLRAVNQKLEDVKSNTVGQMQQRQASSVSQLDQVQDETLRIKSSLEENTSQTMQFREQVSQNLAGLQTTVETNRNEQDAKISDLNQRVTILEEKLSSVVENFTKIQQDRIADAEKRAKAAAERAEAAKQRAASAARSSAAPATVSPASTNAAATAGTANPSSSDLVKVGPTGKKTRIAIAAPPKAAEPLPARKTTTAPVTAPPAATETASPPAAATPKPPVAEQKAVPASTGSDPFAQGMNEFKGKNYKSAYKSFEQSLSANPNSPQAAKTLYYMGESLYNQGEYDLAILDYQKVISNHNKDALTPSALLKQGMAFEKLTDNETAKIIYKKLLNDHPASSEASQAKDRLKKL